MSTRQTMGANQEAGTGQATNAGKATKAGQGTNAKQEVWRGPAQRLDTVLAELGLARSRSTAAAQIAQKKVFVDGDLAIKPGKKIVSGQNISVDESDSDVSRGAKKLRHALNVFAVSAENLLALDVGASTGGFTQVLLEKGANTVIALDVGHDQLVAELAKNPAIISIEGCNARYLTRETLKEMTGIGASPELIVSDVSFISITKIFPAFKSVAAQNANFIVLVKPQFEVGKEHIGSGVVQQKELHEEVLLRVTDSAIEHGFKVADLAASPILGTTGNVEFLMHMNLAVDNSGGAETYRRQLEEKIATLVYGGENL